MTNKATQSDHQEPYSGGLGGGGYCHIWDIEEVCAVKGMVFKQFTLNQKVWVYHRVSFFRKLISLLKILV